MSTAEFLKTLDYEQLKYCRELCNNRMGFESTSKVGAFVSRITGLK
ncbi:hypothetical protein QVM78_18835 [Enterobacter hormaechei]|nr:hypothetical protein [Enterobacter hormaechei]